MKRIDLPVVHIATSLNAVVDTLRTARRSALIAKQHHEFFLFTAGEIVVGRSRGVPLLTDLLEDKMPVQRTPQARYLGRAWRGRLQFGRPRLAGYRLHGYVLTNIRDVSAVLAFRDVDLATRYVSGPRHYYCDGPHHHDDFPPPNVTEGDDCPHRDGHRIVRSPW